MKRNILYKFKFQTIFVETNNVLTSIEFNIYFVFKFNLTIFYKY